jgi:hypothetical protein
VPDGAVIAPCRLLGMSFGTSGLCSGGTRDRKGYSEGEGGRYSQRLSAVAGVILISKAPHFLVYNLRWSASQINNLVSIMHQNLEDVSVSDFASERE